METEKFSPGRSKKKHTRDFLGQKTLQTRSFLFHSFPLLIRQEEPTLNKYVSSPNLLSSHITVELEFLKRSLKHTCYLDTRKSQTIKTAEPIYWLFSAVILL